MQILGFYREQSEYHNREFKFLETLKELRIAQLHLPVIVVLEYSCSNGLSDDDLSFDLPDDTLYMISIFPGFYSIDRHPTIQRALAESFDEDHGPYMSADADRISKLCIHLVDSFDIHVLTKNLTMAFPNIDHLTFYFETPCKVVSFLLIMILLELKSILVISVITGDEKNYLFIPPPG